MPRVSAFYGVVIYMYRNQRDHPLAHFHAFHSGRRASVSVNGEVHAGSLDPRALVVWPDGIDLAPEPLYEQAKAHPLIAA
jgi:Domain of unknown function (DUF4160)